MATTMVKLRVPYPRPHVLDLSSDHRVHRILVPVPVLTASVNHSTIGTFDDIPVQTEVLTKKERWATSKGPRR